MKDVKDPLEQYQMMDRDARDCNGSVGSSAVHFPSEATVMVLGRHGYESGVEGRNGFVCTVQPRMEQRSESLIVIFFMNLRAQRVHA